MIRATDAAIALFSAGCDRALVVTLALFFCTSKGFFIYLSRKVF